MGTGFPLRRPLQRGVGGFLDLVGARRKRHLSDNLALDWLLIGALFVRDRHRCIEFAGVP
jgi:hypothetical protein